MEKKIKKVVDDRTILWLENDKLKNDLEWVKKENEDIKTKLNKVSDSEETCKLRHKID